jgi:hypothetical protein
VTFAYLRATSISLLWQPHEQQRQGFRDRSKRIDRLRRCAPPGRGRLSVRGLVRSKSPRAHLAELDLDFCESELRDRKSLERACAGMRYVFRLAADYRPSSPLARPLRHRSRHQPAAGSPAGSPPWLTPALRMTAEGPRAGRRPHRRAWTVRPGGASRRACPPAPRSRWARLSSPGSPTRGGISLRGAVRTGGLDLPARPP